MADTYKLPSVRPVQLSGGFSLDRPRSSGIMAQGRAAQAEPQEEESFVDRVLNSMSSYFSSEDEAAATLSKRDVPTVDPISRIESEYANLRRPVDPNELFFGVYGDTAEEGPRRPTRRPRDMGPAAAPEPTGETRPAARSLGFRGGVPEELQGTDEGLYQAIVSGESTDYNTVYNGSVIEPEKPITDMTVAEVRAWQDRSVAAGSDSSAAGRFQIISTTLQSLIDEGTLDPDAKFNEATQNKAFNALLERRGYSDFKASMAEAATEEEKRAAVDRFQTRLAREWASIPVPHAMQGRNRWVEEGESYYAGGRVANKSAHSADVIRQLLMGF